MRTALAAFAGLLAVSNAAIADPYVNGYVRKDGTYVQPHYRSAPDGVRSNNWSVQPNVNPYTGQQGTQHPNAWQQPSTGYGGYNSNQRRW
jgi:hypothetical protein